MRVFKYALGLFVAWGAFLLPFAFGLIVAVGAFLLPVWTRVADADVPSSINFQGRLTDGQGNPLTGPQSVVFSVWNQAAGGSQLWSETQNVSVSSGVYNVSLGSLVSLSTGIFSSTGTWLQIQVGADAPMSPRLKFQSTPYAFSSQISSSLLSLLPVNDLFNITPVNLVVSQNSGYTVPAGKNLVIGSVRTGITCSGSGQFTPPFTDTGKASCYLSVSGGHTGTTMVRRNRTSNPSILGPGDVLASTSTNISIQIRGALIPAAVQVVLQDLPAGGGTYTAPAGLNFYFVSIPTDSPCTGNVSIGGFVLSGEGPYAAGMLPSGQTLTNNTNCLLTLDGYLK